MSIEGQGQLLTLAQGRVHTKIQNVFSQKLLCRSDPIFYESFQVQGNEHLMHDAGHMTKMAAMPIYAKNPLKSSSPEQAGRFPRNFVCSIGDSSQT